MLERPMASPLRFLSWLFVNFWGKELFYFLVPMFPLCKYSKCVFWTWTRRCSNPNHFDHQKGESSKCKEFKCKENIFKCKEINSNARKKKFLVIELKIHLCMKICSLGNTFLQFQEALGSLTMIWKAVRRLTALQTNCESMYRILLVVVCLQFSTSIYYR